MRLTPVLAALAAASVLVLCGCAASDQDPDARAATAPPTAEPEPTGDLTVFAAASLRGAFDELVTSFEERHPSLDVLPVVYDGSSTLAAQLLEGAPADVFAAADEDTMKKVTDAGVAAHPEVFATNTLVLVMPAGNPGGVEGLSDLADESLTVILCAPQVPCGAASRTLLSRAGVSVTAASLEQNVTAVLSKVAAGEADAGLVYATDVLGREGVESLVPDGAAEVVNRYPIAALADSANPEAARAFADFVLSEQGQAVLARHGFGGP